MVGMKCKASGDGWSCDKPRAGNGLCSSHYWQSRNKPELTELRSRVKSKWLGGRHWCGACEQYLDPSAFSLARGNKSGLANECKPCSKDRQLRINFNMTSARYHEMLADQGGACAICGQECASGKSLSVDHDHSCCPGKKSCGKCVRRLLCGNCNMGIGLFQDNPDLLRKALAYLEEWQ